MKAKKKNFSVSTIPQYSIEKHGNGYALYYGRNSHLSKPIDPSKFLELSHGVNLCSLSDFDNNGEETRKLIVDALNAFSKPPKSMFPRK